MTKRIVFSSLLVCVCAAGSLTRCSQNSHPDYFGTVRPLHPAHELWLDGYSEPPSLDPQLIHDEISKCIAVNMFLRLTQAHPVTGEPIPDLATSWEVSKDGTVYTFHLRKDAVWSDGTALTAKDVEFAWKRLANPATGSNYSQEMDVVKNARAFREGKVSEQEVGLEVMDDHTLKVTLESPIPYFLGIIENIAFAPVPKHIIEKFREEKREAQWILPKKIVVSGPFLLKTEKFKQYKIFEKNPKYFSASQVKLNRVKTVMFEDYHASLNAYKTGQYDWSFGSHIPADSIDQVKKFKDFHNDERLSVYYYLINSQKKPLNDPKVRKALSLAIDRQSITDKVLRLGQKPTRSLIPEGSIAHYKGPSTELFDPDQAKKLLAEAGYENGKSFPKILIKFNTSDNHRKVAEAVQEMWKQNLGIQVDLTNKEWKILLDELNKMEFEVIRYGWNADYADPATFFSVFLSGSSNNHSGWKNSTYDSLLNQSNRTQDRNQRYALLAKAEEIFNSESPAIPIYMYTRPTMRKPYLKGIWSNPMDDHLWKYMWVDERWYDGVPENPIIKDDQPWIN